MLINSLLLLCFYASSQIKLINVSCIQLVIICLVFHSNNMTSLRKYETTRGLDSVDPHIMGDVSCQTNRKCHFMIVKSGILLFFLFTFLLLPQG